MTVSPQHQAARALLERLFADYPADRYSTGHYWRNVAIDDCNSGMDLEHICYIASGTGVPDDILRASFALLGAFD